MNNKIKLPILPLCLSPIPLGPRIPSLSPLSCSFTDPTTTNVKRPHPDSGGWRTLSDTRTARQEPDSGFLSWLILFTMMNKWQHHLLVFQSRGPFKLRLHHRQHKSPIWFCRQFNNKRLLSFFLFLANYNVPTHNGGPSLSRLQDHVIVSSIMRALIRIRSSCDMLSPTHIVTIAASLSWTYLKTVRPFSLLYVYFAISFL